MAKYRPKHWVMYYYGAENKALISCQPQSRWRLISKTDKKVILANKHTTIHISTEDFETRNTYTEMDSGFREIAKHT